MDEAVGQTRRDALPRLEDDALLALLQQHHGLDVGIVERLPGEVDENIVVVDAAGRRFVAKVSRSADPAHVGMQARLLDHLADKPIGRIVPRPVASVSGGQLTPIDEHVPGATLRLLPWLPGRPMARLHRPSAQLLHDLGATAASLVRDLRDFDDPAAHGSHPWDLVRAPAVLDDGLASIAAEHLPVVSEVRRWFDELVVPRLGELTTGVVHQDLNDANVLADHTGTRVAGVIDFGDALHTVVVAELAIAVGYAMRQQPDPLAAAALVVAGHHEVLALSQAELEVLFPLAAMRLCVNAVNWTDRGAGRSDDYARERIRGSWSTLQALVQIEPAVAAATLRDACGLEVDPAGTRLSAWLDASHEIVPVVDPHGQAPATLALGPDGGIFDDLDWTRPADVRRAVTAAIDAAGVPLTHAAHGLAWLARAGRRTAGGAEPRTIRLGSQLFARAGTRVRAPLAGAVNSIDRDQGILSLRHDPSDGPVFWTHLRGISIADLDPEARLEAGQDVGQIRDPGPDATLPAHVHVQVSAHATRSGTAPPDFVAPSQKRAWTSVCPDPSRLVAAIADTAASPRTADDVVAIRSQRFARSQRHYYQRPMNLVRSRGSWFFDEDGLSYLDVINNVTHVGHCHPHVVEAVSRQLRRLNTNSRLLYEGIATYSERLASTLPDPLEVVFLVCTGSEANDLATRIARQVTGREAIVVIDGAYHGNTHTVTGISPNRFNGPGGSGPPPTTHVVMQPNRYRGPYGYDHPDPGLAYGNELGHVVGRLAAEGRPPAAFFAESLMGTAGQVVLPDGYLASAFARVRHEGGLCISDEVQVGFGRLGETFWGFELGGVVPDIVTMGKPIGNGFPLAAVVTTREIADEFDNGMRYFNTFGGNPVACAAGMAVLDVIEQEGLQARAADAGRLLLTSLDALRSKHQVIGDVRGKGLYVGVELVLDHETKEPADVLAHSVTELLKEEGVVVYPNGEMNNILKLKPPMTTSDDELLLFVELFDRVLEWVG